MQPPVAAIVLAAGMGTRMRSERAKVVHELGGEPMIARVLRAIGALGVEPVVVVVGHQAEAIRETVLRSRTQAGAIFALQSSPRGTGDAARCGLDAIPADFFGDVLIICGDLPMVTGVTLGAFLAAHRQSRSKLSFITVDVEDAASYGRVVRNERGEIESIVEAADAKPEHRAITEVNSGVYLVEAALLRSALSQLTAHNAQDEYYLTDLVAIARRHGLNALGWRAEHAGEFAGVNSREELAEMESAIRKAVNRRLMAEGVTLVDPATAYISEQSEVGPDTIIGPNVQLLGRCRIGRGVRIEGTAYLSNVTIGDRSHIKLGVRAEDSVIGPECEVGPFANLRPDTELEGHNRIGNFVETKKTRLGRGTKASHLSYLGNADIGRNTNIGCGVITVNYDGYEKHQTRIGDRCMVGCDTQLVAPVEVGNDAYVASGTTIVRNVPAGALAVSHHPQGEKSGWVATWRKRHKDPTPVEGEDTTGSDTRRG